jgi:hypothetical protein
MDDFPDHVSVHRSDRGTPFLLFLYSVTCIKEAL